MSHLMGEVGHLQKVTIVSRGNVETLATLSASGAGASSAVGSGADSIAGGPGIGGGGSGVTAAIRLPSSNTQ